MSEEINANNPSEVIYDESKIRHLEDTEHIRTRPGMYIGRLGVRMLKTVSTSYSKKVLTTALTNSTKVLASALRSISTITLRPKSATTVVAFPSEP